MDSSDVCAASVRAHDLDRFLATLYAPVGSRPALLALHALDIELSEVVRTTTEPMLGQIRLAWWREQLQALDAGARPAQPVLVSLAANVLPIGVRGASLEPLEDAYLAWLDDDIDAYAEARSLLFEVALRVMPGQADADLVAWSRRVGKGWAIVEALRRRGADPALIDRADALLGARRVPPPARPLAGLAALARRDLAALRAGHAPAARGTPGRQARLLWSIVTGQ